MHLFGPPRAVVDGIPLSVDTRKAIAVLARLAVDGRQSRQTLAALLWPESDESRARAALRRTLSSLNRALGGRWVVTERDRVELAGDDWRCDVCTFRGHLEATRGHGHAPERPCPACVPELEAAVGLAGADFLADFALRDAPPFDDWRAAEAETLRRELRGALGGLVQALAGAGALEEALAHARRAVDLDPLHEAAQRRLMLLLSWTGRRGDAIRQFRSLAAVLDRELGVRPLEQTAELHRAILEDRAPSPPTSARPRDVAFPAPVANVGRPSVSPGRSPSAGRERAPFVGRDRELAALSRLVAAAGPAGRLAAVRGEAGSGKTRLLEEALAAATASGARTVAVRCHPGDAGLPYAPVITALRESAADAGPGWLDRVPPYARTETARLAPELADLLADDRSTAAVRLNSPAAKARLLEAVWLTLGAALAEAERPGVLALDDLHRADAATLDLLTYLAPRLARHAIVVVVSWRDEELDGAAAWRLALAETRAAGLADDLRLDRLGEHEVRALVAAARPDPSPALVRRLLAETEGLPLAVVAYLEELRTADQDDDAWPVPASLHALFRGRLHELDGMARQVLTAAAVIGRSFDVDTLVAAAGRDDAETVSALERLGDRGMIVEVEPSEGLYDFSHDKLRSVAYDEASLARRRLLHRRVAAALRARPVRDAADAGRIALHDQLGGDEAAAATMHEEAGRRARALYANRDALLHYRQALALGHPAPDRLHEEIGDLETREADYAGALVSYDTAAALTDDPARLAALEHKAGAVHLRAGDLAAAEARFDAALRALGDADQPGLRALIRSDRSLGAARAGRLDEALAEARRALAVAERARDPRAVARARNILGLLTRRAGDLEEAVEHLEASAGLSQRLGDLDGRVAALNNLALAFADLGREPDGLEVAREAVALSSRLGDRHREAALHSNLADLLHACGREEEAREHLTRSAGLFATLGEAPARTPELWRLTDW